MDTETDSIGTPRPLGSRDARAQSVRVAVRLGVTCHGFARVALVLYLCIYFAAGVSIGARLWSGGVHSTAEQLALHHTLEHHGLSDHHSLSCSRDAPAVSMELARAADTAVTIATGGRLSAVPGASKYLSSPCGAAPGVALSQLQRIPRDGHAAGNVTRAVPPLVPPPQSF